MPGSVARKVSAALLAILLGTMAAAGVFTYSKLESVSASLVRSRYAVQVLSIKRNVEDRLNLGFPLRQLRPIQDVVEREKAGDPEIVDIQIFDAHGEVVFDSDRGSVGTVVPSNWLNSLGNGEDFAADDDRVVGLPLINGFGQVEGGVVLHYPSASLERGMGPTAMRLLGKAAVLLAVFAPLAVLGSYLLLNKVARRLATMGTILGKVVAEGGEVVPDDGSDALETGFAAFATRIREATDRIRAASDDVERLDRLT